MVLEVVQMQAALAEDVPALALVPLLAPVALRQSAAAAVQLAAMLPALWVGHLRRLRPHSGHAMLPVPALWGPAPWGPWVGAMLPAVPAAVPALCRTVGGHSLVLSANLWVAGAVTVAVMALCLWAVLGRLPAAVLVGAVQLAVA